MDGKQLTKDLTCLCDAIATPTATNLALKLPDFGFQTRTDEPSSRDIGTCESPEVSRVEERRKESRNANEGGNSITFSLGKTMGVVEASGKSERHHGATLLFSS